MRRASQGWVERDGDGHFIPREEHELLQQLVGRETKWTWGVALRNDYPQIDGVQRMLMREDVVEMGARRRHQLAYLARYAPGAGPWDDVPTYEMMAWVEEVSSIVRQENGQPSQSGAPSAEQLRQIATKQAM